jgi:hypothetical protein
LSDVLLFVILFFVLMSYFSTVYPIPPIKQGLVMCCSFVIPFFVFGLKSIFQQSYPIPTYKAGIE